MRNKYNLENGTFAKKKNLVLLKLLQVFGVLAGVAVIALSISFFIIRYNNRLYTSYS